jgi:epoxyqueuosine reductase
MPSPASAPVPESAALTARIQAEAARLGFAACAALPAEPSRTQAFYAAWLAAGMAGEMAYLHRHAAPKQDPRALLPEARSVLALAFPYDAPQPTLPAADPTPRGRVSRYARGADYHDVLHEKLAALADFIGRTLGRPVRHRACVDSAPVMERELAARAGLGWVGRNAMLIHWRHGSWLFLAELLLDVPLAPSVPPPRRRGQRGRAVPPPEPLAAAGRRAALDLRESCGTCTACLSACPTGAIVGDKTVDARRCLSYLTIELKGPVPEALRPALGDWVFGCDLCQDVCPWNRRSRPTPERAFHGDAERAFPSLVELLGLDPAGFRARFRHTPLWRPRRRGILRNAALALGNRLAADAALGRAPAPAALDALRRALGDPEPLVRGAAAWALGRAAPAAGVAGVPVLDWLRAALSRESDGVVRTELERALQAGEASPVGPEAGAGAQPRR